MPLLWTLLLPAFLPFAHLQGAAPSPAPVDEVIAAERAFAAAAGTLGTKPAFLAYFAEDAVSFGPAPTVGKRVIAEGPEMPPIAWWPEIAEASAAGDMGYTSGPYRATRPDGSFAWGHYHTIWGRQPDGSWKVLLDMGGPHGPADEPSSVTVPERPAAPSASAGVTVADLLAADAACLARYQAGGAAAELAACAWPDARIYRFGNTPFRGTVAALEDATTSGEVLSWTAEGGRVATSGDFGFTYGTGTVRRAETGNDERGLSFARFWRRDGDGAWRYVTEIVLPYPRSPGA